MKPGAEATSNAPDSNGVDDERAPLVCDCFAGGGRTLERNLFSPFADWRGGQASKRQAEAK
jgi:hypothetical protein